MLFNSNSLNSDILGTNNPGIFARGRSIGIVRDAFNSRSFNSKDAWLIDIRTVNYDTSWIVFTDIQRDCEWRIGHVFKLCESSYSILIENDIRIYSYIGPMLRWANIDIATIRNIYECKFSLYESIICVSKDLHIVNTDICNAIEKASIRENIVFNEINNIIEIKE